MSSGGHAIDELVEDAEHLGARSRRICCLGDIERGLVTGSHQYMRERADWLRADLATFDAVRQEGLDQAEHMPLADLPPVHPAENRRPVDKGDPVDLRLNADVQPRSNGVPQSFQRIGNRSGCCLIGQAPGDIGLNGLKDSFKERSLVREVVI